MCPCASHPCKKCALELNPGALIFENRHNPKNGYINSPKIRGTIPPDCAQINGNGDQGELDLVFVWFSLFWKNGEHIHGQYLGPSMRLCERHPTLKKMGEQIRLVEDNWRRRFCLTEVLA